MNITLVDAFLRIADIGEQKDVEVYLANIQQSYVFVLTPQATRRLYEQLGRALQRAKETL